MDPLQTDEKLEKPAPKVPDFERQLMGGCFTIGLLAIAVYIAGALPFFFVLEYTVQGLVTGALLGWIPAALVCAFLIHKMGIAGASGYLGGSLCAVVFIFLRLGQVMAGKMDPSLPAPEYPDDWAWLVPLVWMIGSIVVTLLAYPKEEPADRGSGSRR